MEYPDSNELRLYDLRQQLHMTPVKDDYMSIDTTKPVPQSKDIGTNTSNARQQMSAAKIFGNNPISFVKEGETDMKKAAYPVGGTKSISSPTAISEVGKGALTGASAITSAATLGLGNIISSGISGLSSFFQNRENNNLSREMLDREWNAAKQLGLSSPSQFGTSSSMMAKSTGSRLTASFPKTVDKSPFSI